MPAACWRSPRGAQDSLVRHAGLSAKALLAPSAYVDSVPPLPRPWLESVAPIWRDTPSPYGPLFVLLSGAMVALGGTLVASIALFRAIAIVGVGITALCLPALARRCEIPESQAVW